MFFKFLEMWCCVTLHLCHVYISCVSPCALVWVIASMTMERVGNCWRVCMVPRLLVGMAAHTGQHYWTNADTRSTANSMQCFTSACCVLSWQFCSSHCRCGNPSSQVMPLYIWTWAVSWQGIHFLLLFSSFSPYVQAPSDSGTENGPVKPAESVEISNTSNDSVAICLKSRWKLSNQSTIFLWT